MRFGLFGGAQSAGPDPSRGYFDYLDLLQEAEALGYDGCFLTEHHFTGWGQVSAPLHLLTWLAARTTRLRLGTAVMVLAWHNPMLLAEQVATVDLLSRGRLDLGIGRGYRHNEFHGFATDPKEADARFEESLAIMRAAWTSTDRFSFRGQFWRFDDVILEPPVTQAPHPPLWVSAGRPESIRRAGTSGFRLLLDQFTPVPLIAERIALYRSSVEAAGRPFDPDSVAVARDLFIVEGQEGLRAALDRRAQGHQRMIDAARVPGQIGGSHVLAWAEQAEARDQAALYGPAAVVEEKLSALRSAGARHILVNIPGQSRDTLRHFAHRVIGSS